jgi:hypothetical protein
MPGSRDIVKKTDKNLCLNGIYIAAQVRLEGKKVLGDFAGEICQIFKEVIKVLHQVF